MATEIVPFTPPVAEEQVETVAGEVITPEGELLTQERIIKKGWKVAQQKASEVYAALTIIHTKNLWKLHHDLDGKRKYTSFETYLFTEFGWKLDRTRALQIIKQERPKLLEAGVLTAEDMPKERTRSAPEVTPTKAAQVTIKQLEGALEAFSDRIDNVAEGAGRGQLEDAYAALEAAMQEPLDLLRFVITDEAQRAADEVAANAAEVAARTEAPASEEANTEEVPTELSPLRA